MTDPTFDEMHEFLLGLYGVDADNEARVAIYWFSSHSYVGQCSNLYAALMVSRFKPGPIATLESEGEGSMVQMMYDDLETHFAGE